MENSKQRARMFKGLFSGKYAATFNTTKPMRKTNFEQMQENRHAEDGFMDRVKRHWTAARAYISNMAARLRWSRKEEPKARMSKGISYHRGWNSRHYAYKSMLAAARKRAS
jgi:hypothetical protein